MTRLLRTADHVLSPIGIALLVLSLALVPTNKSFADDGGGDGPLATACMGTDGCNNGSCAPIPNTNNCNQTGGCPNGGGCSGCPCTGCWKDPGTNSQLCDCQCQTGQFNRCSQCPPPNQTIWICTGSGHPCQ
jgi:hypothetical protein